MFFYVQRKVHPMHSTRIYSQESLAFSIFKTASRRLIPDAIFNNRRIYLWITSCQNENRALSLSHAETAWILCLAMAERSAISTEFNKMFCVGWVMGASGTAGHSFKNTSAEQREDRIYIIILNVIIYIRSTVAYDKGFFHFASSSLF